MLVERVFEYVFLRDVRSDTITPYFLRSTAIAIIQLATWFEEPARDQSYHACAILACACVPILMTFIGRIPGMVENWERDFLSEQVLFGPAGRR
jgi:hypothetical protein